MLASNLNRDYASNCDEASLALVTALGYRYHKDPPGSGRRKTPFRMKQKEDYMVFWADEHVHFNYAMQWFGMGSLTLSMTLYKFIEVLKWRF